MRGWLPFATIDVILIDGERLFAFVHRVEDDTDALLVVFPRFGEPDYAVVAGVDAFEGKLSGMTEQWSYINGYRAPRL